MAYNQNIPQPADQLNNSQQDLLNNFQGIKTLIDINHVTFDVANQGKHNLVTLPNNAAPTATIANEMSLFSQASTFATLFGNNTALFYQAANGGDIKDMTSAGITGAPIEGFTRLASGLLVKFGRAQINGINQVHNYPVGANIPVFAVNPYVVMLTPFTGSGDRRVVCVNLLGIANFNASAVDTSNVAQNVEVFYVAIGR